MFAPKYNDIKCECIHCGYSFKERKSFYYFAKDRELFLNPENNVTRFVCPSCEKITIVPFHFIYADEERKYIIVYDDRKELLYHKYTYKINKEYTGYKIIGATNYYDLSSIILSIEHNLDWRIVQLYLKDAAISINRARSKIDKTKNNVLATFLAKQDGQLKIVILTFCNEIFVAPFKQDQYDKAYQKYIDWIEDINPFFLDNLAILELLENKKQKIIYPVGHYFYVDYSKGIELCLCNSELAKTIQIGNVVIFRTQELKIRLIGKVVGHEILNYYKVPILYKKISVIQNLVKRFVNFINYEDVSQANKKAIAEIIKFNNADKIKPMKIAMRNMFSLLKESRFIVVNPTSNKWHLFNGFFDSNNNQLSAIAVSDIHHHHFISLFTSEEKVNVDGELFILDFDTIYELFKNNPGLDGLIFDNDENIVLTSLPLSHYETKILLNDDQKILSFFKTLDEFDIDYFDGFEYQCLYKRLIEHKSFKTIAKEHNTSIHLAKREYDFAILTLEDIASRLD